METAEPLYRVGIEMRFRDLDAYGHVNNAVVFNYLEVARVRFLGEHFTVEPQDDEPLYLVKRAECEYKRPIPLLDRIYIELHLEELRSSSFRLGYRLCDRDGTEYARAETVMVTVDSRSGRPTRVPDWLRSRLTTADHNSELGYTADGSSLG